MNTNVLIGYLAIGAMAKLLTLRYPTPGQQWAAGVEVIAGAVVSGVVAELLLPGADGWKALVFAGIPFAFAALGRWLAPMFERVRFWWDERSRNGTAAETNGSTSTNA